MKILILLFSAIFMLAACGDVGGSESRIDVGASQVETDSSEPGEWASTVCTSEYPPETIVIVKWYTNAAWGVQSNGRFITLDGSVYEFDLTENGDRGYYSDNSELMAVLENIRDTTEPTKQVDGDIIAECLTLAADIDRDAEFRSEFTACDAGQDTIYAVYEGEMIKLYTGGDSTGELKDKNARKILDELNAGKIMSTWRP